MAQRTRTNELKIYLNDDEKKLLDEKVQQSEMVSTAAYIRQLIKYGCCYTIDYAELHDMVQQIHGAATNINQVAHKVNATNTVCKSDMDKLKKELNEIWHIVRSILSASPSVEQ